jgi:hypothetical protein
MPCCDSREIAAFWNHSRMFGGEARREPPVKNLRRCYSWMPAAAVVRVCSALLEGNQGILELSPLFHEQWRHRRTWLNQAIQYHVVEVSAIVRWVVQ